MAEAVGAAGRSFTTVLWDFGGVITTSPFEAFNALEAERGLPHDLVRMINAANPDDNAWAQFERAEIDASTFDAAFAAEAAAMGHVLPGRDVIACLSGAIRPRMVLALDRLKAAGYGQGCITNNVPAGKGSGVAASDARAAEMGAVLARFDHVIESRLAGLRKPDPRIYLMMCDALRVRPEECVYLDDLGINCKPAATLGMRAIKVGDEAGALAELARALGLPPGWPE